MARWDARQAFNQPSTRVLGLSGESSVKIGLGSTSPLRRAGLPLGAYRHIRPARLLFGVSRTGSIDVRPAPRSASRPSAPRFARNKIQASGESLRRSSTILTGV